ncbi:2,3-diketo-L-gulonate TRAP transporter small permease protein YiaM [Labrenzia sp. THAF82]|uniref:TRAP transporter small permease n=1 Tax=Labrenzia sp. THAF82 TaxID=2587861 RepID=UPI0012679581|nr:TRAP transporter small permease [Labrenzia sp. THAF82]QFT30608.1 2,3-diketo-L-gulonate TRAP transporter small permease protein YiaM [Labrenzia sp. THAF82]
MKTLLLTANRGIEFAEKAIIIIAVLLMMVNSTANAIGRYAFGQSLFFAEELNQFLIVGVTFVGFAYAVRRGRNIRMTAVYDALSPRSKKVLLTLISLTTGLLLMFLTYKSVLYVQEVKEINRLSPALQFPVYLIYAVIPVGLAMASLQYLIAFLMNVTQRGTYLSLDVQDGEAEDIGV